MVAAASSSSGGTSGSAVTYAVAVLWPGGTQVYTVGPSANAPVASQQVGGVTGVPSWSADGTMIAFNEHVDQSPSYYYGKVAVFDSNTGASIATVLGTDPSFDPLGGDDFLVDLHPGGPIAGPGLGWAFTDDAGMVVTDFTQQPTDPQFGDSEAVFLLGGALVTDSTVIGASGSNTDAGTAGVSSFAVSPFGDLVYYLATGSTACDLYSASADDTGFTAPGAIAVSDVGCSSTIAFTSDELYVALADGASVYVLSTSATTPVAESSLTPYLTASGSVGQVAFTPDIAYLVYSILTPDGSNPPLGTLALTFVPYVEGQGFAPGGERSLSGVVGQTYAISPVTQ